MGFVSTYVLDELRNILMVSLCVLMYLSISLNNFI